MMFRFVGIIVLNIFCPLNSIWKSCMPSFPAILALRYAWVYICTSDGGNIASYIEASVNKTSHLASTLNIPDIHPNYSHVQLREDFDNMQFWCQNNIIENLVLFDDIFNHIWSDKSKSVFLKVRDAYDFEIGLWLRKMRNFHSFHINMICAFYIIFNGLKIWWWYKFVSHNSDTC